MGNRALPQPLEPECYPPVQRGAFGLIRPLAPVGGFWICPDRDCGRVFIVVKMGILPATWVRVSRRKFKALAALKRGAGRSTLR